MVSPTLKLNFFFKIPNLAITEHFSLLNWLIYQCFDVTWFDAWHLTEHAWVQIDVKKFPTSNKILRLDKKIKSPGWESLPKNTLPKWNCLCTVAWNRWPQLILTVCEHWWVYSIMKKKTSIPLRYIHYLLSIWQAFVKFHEIPIKISFNGSPSKSPTGFLPYLKTEDSDTLLSGYEEIIAHFQSKVYFLFHHPSRSKISLAFLISGLQRRWIFIIFIHLSIRNEAFAIR